MPLGPLTFRARSLLGWLWLTPVEWAFVLVIAWLGFRGAWPRYAEWRAEHLLQAEQHAVMQVRAALFAPDAVQRSCPAALDTCPDGSTAGECPFFAAILPSAAPLDGWRKSGGHYLGPAGGRYRYHPRTCQFLPVTVSPDAK